MNAQPRFAAVTTMNRQGYETTGSRMIGSYVRHWPETVPLYLYREGFEAEHEKLQVRDLTKRCPGLIEFKERHRENLLAHGRGDEALKLGRMNGWPDQQGYHYRLDAVRFAHKTFAMIDACLSLGEVADIVIWMDADTLTHADVTEQWLSDLFQPSDALIALLFREREYPETGFYMINLGHPETGSLINRWRKLYEEDRLFESMEQWTDSWVIWKLFEGAKAANLSGEKGRKTSHPLANGPLGARLDHLKGKWKTLERSPRGAVRSWRREAHWR